MGRIGVAVVVAVGTAVAVGIAGLAAARPAPASPGSATTAVVSLGDSFISGEGGRWMGNGSDRFGARSGTDRAAFACGPSGGCRHDPHRVYGESEDSGCHRSDVAPILSAPIAAGEAVNLACSGAQARNVWRAVAGGRSLRGEPPQADQLAAVAGRDDVKLVVVTVGANDVGFGNLVIGCALDWARSPPATRASAGAAGRLTSRPRCPPCSAASAGRCDRSERRWRMPATGFATTGW